MLVHKQSVRLLASVTNESEARLAVSGGADIIDAKNPAQGALGALPVERVTAIMRAVDGRVPVSATIGDVACEPDLVEERVAIYAATGVDYVKVGLFAGGDPQAAIARSGSLDLGRSHLVGVLMADQDPDFSLIAAMGRAGFAGVMLDTFDKSAGALPDVMGELAMRTFVAFAREVGIFAGLAGALRLRHVPALLEIGPGILGFRGALCYAHERSAGLDTRAMQAIRAAIPQGADQTETSHEEVVSI